MLNSSAYLAFMFHFSLLLISVNEYFTLISFIEIMKGETMILTQNMCMLSEMESTNRNTSIQGRVKRSYYEMSSRIISPYLAKHGNNGFLLVLLLTSSDQRSCKLYNESTSVNRNEGIRTNENTWKYIWHMQEQTPFVNLAKLLKHTSVQTS